MKVKNVMTKEVVCCTPSDSVQTVARIMKGRDVGAVPVVSDQESRRLVGIVTDRDLCCTVIAGGKAPEVTSVRESMTPNPFTCGPEDTLEDCEKLMQKHRVRRVPVVDERGRCVGIITQADIALHASPEKVRKTVAEISRPWRARQPARIAAA
jgi:CBS domain-containing protein